MIEHLKERVGEKIFNYCHQKTLGSGVMIDYKAFNTIRNGKTISVFRIVKAIYCTGNMNIFIFTNGTTSSIESGTLVFSTLPIPKLKD